VIFATLMLYSLLLQDSVAFRVELPPAAQAGEPVPVVLRLTNRTERPLTLTLQGRPLAFDVTVAGRLLTDTPEGLATRPASLELLAHP
jgi:uncharacterized protein (DUF58 family)